MNIEFKFLQKAIEDRNYVSFSYNNEKYENIQPLKLIEEKEQYLLKTEHKSFEFKKISRLKILKNRF